MTILVLQGSAFSVNFTRFALSVKILAENLKKMAVTWLPGYLLFGCMSVSLWLPPFFFFCTKLYWPDKIFKFVRISWTIELRPFSNLFFRKFHSQVGLSANWVWVWPYFIVFPHFIIKKFLDVWRFTSSYCFAEAFVYLNIKDYPESYSIPLPRVVHLISTSSIINSM